MNPLPVREGLGVGQPQQGLDAPDVAYTAAIESLGAQTRAPTPNPSLAGRGVRLLQA